MDYAARTNIGLGKARRDGINEDSVSAAVFESRHREDVRQGAGVFVVADGVGSYQHSDFASYLTTTVVTNELKDVLFDVAQGTSTVIDEIGIVPDSHPEPPNDDKVQNAIAEAIQAADERLESHSEVGRGATTVVVGVYGGGNLHLGWVGDSKATVINRSARSIELLTRDHSIVQHYVEEESLRPEVAKVHDESSTITRAVGGKDSTVETRSVPIYGDDIVLFASDGLYDAYDRGDQLYRKYLRAEDDTEEEKVINEIVEKTVTQSDIRDIVLQAQTLETACESLYALSQRKGGDDNVSALLFTDASQQARRERDDSVSRVHPAHRDDTDVDQSISDGETIINE